MPADSEPPIAKTPDTTQMTRRKKLHPGWTIGSVVAGLALVALAHLGELFWKWPSATFGTLTSLGAALLLAFILFMLEDRFTREIAENVTTTARTVAQEESEKVTERVASLEQQLAARRQAEIEHQSTVAESVAESPSYDTVWAALEKAHENGVIRSAVVVRGTPDLGYPLVRFGLYGVREPHEVQAKPGAPLELDVSVFTAGSAGRGINVSHIWQSVDEAVDVAQSLEAALRRAGLFPEAKALDFAFAVNELVRVLRMSIADQSLPSGQETFDAPLHQALSTDWYVTSKGVINTATGYKATFRELGFKQKMLGAWTSATKAPAPEGTTDEEWDFVWNRLGFSANL